MNEMTGIKFDVFGRTILIVKDGNRWRAYYPGPDGKKMLADFVIPDFVTTEELPQYLDDLFHEDARPGHMTVTKLEE